MTLRYLSVCSGIEAASVAWRPLGFTPFAFAEIDRFPSQVLAHHYGSNLPGEALSHNAPPNLGDMSKFRDWPDAALDLLVGGTPCQSFSVAGLRKGLADPRGNLALTYLAIADRYRPAWILWENVPGVLSSGNGRDFGAFLGALGQLGYGFAYRVLDAQFVRVDGFSRAVPQRRRRVFVVGHSSGDWRRAAAVLFDAQSLRWDSAPRRQAREDVAGALTSTAGRRCGVDDPERGNLIPQASLCLNGGGMGRIDAESETLIPTPTHGGVFDVAADVAATLPSGGNATGGARQPGMSAETAATMLIAHDVAASLTRGAESAGKCSYSGRRQEDDVNRVAHALRAEGFDASEDGTGRGTPIVPIAFPERLSATQRAASENIAPALGATNPTAVAFDMRGREGGAQFEGPHDTANIRAASGGSSKSYVAEQWAVRRLTPTECERLQGFPDGYTRIPVKDGFAADGPRYKALGNSMAVNVMRWIGARIAMVEAVARNDGEGRPPARSSSDYRDSARAASP